MNDNSTNVVQNLELMNPHEWAIGLGGERQGTSVAKRDRGTQSGNGAIDRKLCLVLFSLGAHREA
jgi:hypothetical protein